MPSKKWTLQYPDGFQRFIKRLGGNELKQFKIKVKELENAINPKELGQLKGTKKYGFCYVIDITKSYRLAYRINEQHHTILLVCVDDRKGLYGRDKKS